MSVLKTNVVTVILSLIGEKAALRLMDAKNFGGAYFHFPKRATGQGAATYAHLAEVVGETEAKALCNYFGGGWVYIPKLTQYYLQERNKRLVLDYNSGKSVRELARDYGLSDRRICEVLKTTDLNQSVSLSQLSLF